MKKLLAIGVRDSLQIIVRSLGCVLTMAGFSNMPVASHAQTCTPAPDGLVAWWKAEHTAQDVMGNANGNLVGTANYGPGRVGAAFAFHVEGDAVTLGNPAALRLQNFTIEGWVRRASTTSAGHQVILSYGAGGYGLAMFPDGTLYLTKAAISRADSSVRIADTNWHHVAVSKAGASVVFYLDGAGSPALTFDASFVFDSNIAIGARGDLIASLIGQIDEVSIYNRALNAAEVSAIFAASSSGKCLDGLILRQPQSLVTQEGSTITMSVAAVGSPPPSYQWRRAGVNLVDGGRVTGAATTNLTLSNVQLSDAGAYTVLVSNPSLSTTSSVAMVQVLPVNAPSIRIDGEPAVGTVIVPHPPTVAISGGFPGGFIFYTLNDSTPTPSSVFYAGPFVLTSNAVIRAMSISSSFAQSAYAPPVELVIPPSYALQTVVVGNGTITVNPLTGPYASNTVVTVTAQAGAHWAFDHWEQDLFGNTNPAQVVMGGPRSVRAVFRAVEYPLTAGSPGGGSVTADGQTIPANRFYPVGSTVLLHANADAGWSFLHWEGSASGTANPYSLLMDQTNSVQAIYGTVVGWNTAGNGSIQMSTPNPVPYGAALTVTAIPAAGSRFVTWSGAVSGTNPVASFSVTTATPVVAALFAGLPFPSIVAQPTNVNVVIGGTATFSVTAVGEPPLKYQWRKEGAPLAAGTNATLILPVVTLADAGGYDAVVENVYGNRATSAVATVTVYQPVAITGQPLGQVVPFGGTATFQVTAIGEPPPSYQWRFNGANLAGANGASLIITNVTPEALGQYDAAVWNTISATTSAPAVLLMSPSLRGAFVGATLTWGKPGSVTVTAVGSPPLDYQWYKDASPVAGGTNATLEFPVVELSDAGMYSVVISSPWGAVTNAPAQVVVNPANMTLGMYAGVTIEGVPGYNYTIQYSTDLRDTNSWVTATNLTLTLPVELWVDTSVNTLGNPKRFYRILAH